MPLCRPTLLSVVPVNSVRKGIDFNVILHDMRTFCLIYFAHQPLSVRYILHYRKPDMRFHLILGDRERSNDAPPPSLREELGMPT